MSGPRGTAAVTAAYWTFTLTDGALRVLVLLAFQARGVGPLGLAALFVLYEACGVVTNAAGGWLAARVGLRPTLLAGLGLQVGALGLLALLPSGWSATASVAYVTAAQALSGIAKDLTKMSAKSAIKALAKARGSGAAGDDGPLLRWVALITGSKNALKGGGFFLGGALLGGLGFRGAALAMAIAVALALLLALATVPADLGRMKATAARRSLWARAPAVNQLAVARLALFAARDAWFVIGVPVFLRAQLGWRDAAVGAFLAAWVIGYGLVQAATPSILRRVGRRPDGATAAALATTLAGVVGATALGVGLGAPPALIVVVGLALFALVFALSSAVHSYLILAYASDDDVALDVGFYYMANAAGRLLGTALSGVAFLLGGVVACLACAAGLAALAAVASTHLPAPALAPPLDAASLAGGD